MFQVSLAPSNTGSGWQFFFQREALLAPAGFFIPISVVDGGTCVWLMLVVCVLAIHHIHCCAGVTKTTWSNDRVRVLSGFPIPWSPVQTYSFYVRVNGFDTNYNGVFFRGGNQAYTNALGTYVSGGLDRTTAVWVTPNEAQLHIRVSTTSNWNNGCDPDLVLTLGTWYHVAIVLESSLMQVFYDGVLQCVTDYGAGERLIMSPDRQLGLVNYQVRAHAMLDSDYLLMRCAVFACVTDREWAG
jgi:hypothetical protein